MGPLQKRDVVWTKMKGYPLWPGHICEPPEEMSGKKMSSSVCVYFFGSNNYAWIKEKDILRHTDALLRRGLKSKGHGIRSACRELQQYLEDKKEVIDDARDRSSPVNVKILEEPKLSQDETTKKTKNLKTTDVKKASTRHKKELSGSKGVTVQPSTSTESREEPSSSKNDTLQPSTSTGHTEEPSSSAEVHNETDHSSVIDCLPSTSTQHLEDSQFPYDGECSTSKAPSTEQMEDPPVPGCSKAFIPHNYKCRTNGIYSYPSSTFFSRRRTAREQFYSAQLELKRSRSTTQREAGSSSFCEEFGPLGIWGMTREGFEISKKLLQAGFELKVWSPDNDLLDDLSRRGVEIQEDPCDVVAESSIIFCFIGGPKGVLGIWESFGLHRGLAAEKGIVEMSHIDCETSRSLSVTVKSTGAKYLEAQVQGGWIEAQNGKLVLLCAGDVSLYVNITNCFDPFCAGSFYLGVAGIGCELNAIIQLIKAIMVAGMAEGLALAKRSGFNLTHVVQIFRECSLNSRILVGMGEMIAAGKLASKSHELPLGQIKTDLWNALRLGDKYHFPLPLTAGSRELFSYSKTRAMEESFYSVFF